MYISREQAEQRYAQVNADVPQGLGATRTNLQRLLRSIDRVGWSTNEESGRLNRKALVKFATGSANIFSRREYVEAEASAVSILIDCSGSMKDQQSRENPLRRIDVAQQVAIHLSKILQQSRVPFAVTGFRATFGSSRILQNGVETSAPLFIPFKTWKQSLHQAAVTLGAINESARGGTPDYSAIYNALDDLSKRSESRKILFILTDASGYMPTHMEHLQSLADRVGITIVAIGIQSNDVVSCFVNAAEVDDLSQLAGASFNQLLKAVRRKK
jgi:cobalamin biosynthesis protein CobT